MRAILLASALCAGICGEASARVLSVGTYLCTVEQRAGIGTNHLEGAPPPTAYSGPQHYRFRISVTAEGDRLRIVETAYTGADRSNAQWEDDNSTLHDAYLGEGDQFSPEHGQGFLDFARNAWGEGVQFHRAGFEYAGGEDEQVSIRWGRCVKEAEGQVR